ncbi:peptidylprolyl isomerase [candidate division KSB1 bacterium]|nr:peptidylprolyl isomerase [candidate division KSB1 bacterium]
MKKVFVISFLLLALMIGCGKKSGAIKLKKGTPAYETAKELAMLVPSLDPDKNQIVVTCTYFDISTGDVIQHLFNNMGKDAAGIAQLPAERIQQEINRAISQLAEKQLLYQVALEFGVTVDDTEVDSLLQNQYQRFQGQEKFEEWALEKGIDLEFVRKDFSSLIMIEKMLDEKFTDQITVTDADVEEAYGQAKTATVRHILLNTTSLSDSTKIEVQKKAEDLLARAKKGENFEKLVKDYSEDPGSKDRGGLYSDFERGTMVKSFEEAAFNTPIGEFSLVETRFGYHIMKIESRKGETKPFDEVKEQLKASLAAQKKTDAYMGFLEELKETTEFEVIPL